MSNGQVPAIFRGGTTGSGGNVDATSHIFEDFAQPIRESFVRFIELFETEDSDRVELLCKAELSVGASGVGGFYLRAIEAIVKGSDIVDQELVRISNRSRVATVNLSLRDLGEYNDGSLKEWATTFTPEIISLFDETLTGLVESHLSNWGVSECPVASFRCAFIDHDDIKSLRDLNPDQIETLVSTKGICIRASTIIPEMQVAVFMCMGKASRDFNYVICGHEVSARVIRGFVEEPQFCERCQSSKGFTLAHRKCVYTSKQLVKVQETPESIPEGETPQTLFAFLYDDLTDSMRAGDHVTLSGIYRALSVKRSAYNRQIRAVFRTAIDVLACSTISATPNAVPLESWSQDADEDFHGILKSEQENPEHHARLLEAAKKFTPSFIAQAREFSRQPDVFQTLVASFAPNIWEYADVKKGLLCQLFGGVAQYSDNNKVRSRGDLHVLLCGDPSTAKSQLLQYVHKVSPRGVYTVGRGTSAAGLTASVSRDPETREFVLESGAVVLSDNGICCIDEFDKMDEGTRAVLYEVMEQQTVSFAKAGIVCSLNSRVGLLASANPIKSKYDKRKSVVENINMPPTLLSRFDLIYLMLDINDPVQDKRLAEHICSLYTDDAGMAAPTNHELVSEDFLRRYIAYAKIACSPKLGPAASTLLVEEYLALRGHESGGSVLGTPRQLDSIIRIATALAKMELSNTVGKLHISEAIRLLRAATYTSLTDPLTGRIDFDQLHLGISENARIRQCYLENLLMKLLGTSSTGLSKGDIEDMANAALSEDNKPQLGIREMGKIIDHADAIGLIGRVGMSNYVMLKNSTA